MGRPGVVNTHADSEGNAVGGSLQCLLFPVDEEGRQFPDAEAMFYDDASSSPSYDLPQLARYIEDGGYERAFVLCHGWNNDIKAARRLYKQIIIGLSDAAAKAGVTYAQQKKDLYIGLIWPGVIIADTWPEYVASYHELPSPEDAPNYSTLGRFEWLVMNELSKSQRLLNLHSLASTFGFSVPELDRLQSEPLELVKELFKRRTDIISPPSVDSPDDHNDDAADGDPVSSPVDYIRRVLHMARLDKKVKRGLEDVRLDDHGLHDEGDFDDLLKGLPDAFLLLLRAPTGKKMKDRAGIIGSRSHPIRALLATLLRADLKGGVNLLGHSYGNKLLLDAVKGLFDATHGAHGIAGKKFNSFMLAQPAISRWVFSPNGKGVYRRLFEGPGYFKRPATVLFSDDDTALRYLYPLGFFTSPAEKDERVRKMVTLKPVLGSTWKVAALGCHGPEFDTDAAFAEAMVIQGDSHNYGFASRTTKVVGVKGDWGHGFSTLDGNTKGAEMGWGRPVFYRLFYELTKMQ